MKINCPDCQCAYDLEPLRMPSPKYNATQESWGWKFECGACDYQWWLKLTNIQDRIELQNNAVNNDYAEQYFYNNRYQKTQSGASNRQNYSKFVTEEVKNLPIVAPKRHKIYKDNLIPPPILRQDINDFFKSKQSNSSSLFWVYTFFLLVILFGILYTYHEVFHQKWKNFALHTSSRILTTSLPLNIKQVRWNKTINTDGSVKVTVIGEVVNQNQAESKLGPLYISAWGECNPAEKTVSRCKIGSYIYNFQKPTILPEEHLSFSTSWNLSKGSTINGVDVTLN